MLAVTHTFKNVFKIIYDEISGDQLGPNLCAIITIKQQNKTR